LQPDGTYTVVPVDLADPEPTAEAAREEWRGGVLMDQGLAWPLTDACTARILVLQRTDADATGGTGGAV
jgi:hypothetical protein